MRIIVLLGIALIFSSCGFGRKDLHKQTSTRPGNKWGYFNGPVDVRWEADGLSMTLLSELRYTDPKGVVWIAPAGSNVNGASIPRALWSVFGGPFEGKYRNASVLHDVAYDQKTRPWQQVDRMFYDAMRCSGVGVMEAKTFYFALYRHGHHWKFKKNSEETRPTAINPTEVDTIHQWIKTNDPSLDQIEAKAEEKPD